MNPKILQIYLSHANVTYAPIYGETLSCADCTNLGICEKDRYLFMPNCAVANFIMERVPGNIRYNEGARTMIVSYREPRTRLTTLQHAVDTAKQQFFAKMK